MFLNLSLDGQAPFTRFLVGQIGLVHVLEISSSRLAVRVNGSEHNVNNKRHMNSSNLLSLCAVGACWNVLILMCAK